MALPKLGTGINPSYSTIVHTKKKRVLKDSWI